MLSKFKYKWLTIIVILQCVFIVSAKNVGLLEANTKIRNK
jgi:hypothetical protein